MSSRACEYPRCSWSLELHEVSSFYSHLRGTRTKSVPPYPGENRARCTVPGAHQQIQVKSRCSRAHRILSYLANPRQGMYDIQKHHAIKEQKKEEIYGLNFKHLNIGPIPGPIRQPGTSSCKCSHGTVGTSITTFRCISKFIWIYLKIFKWMFFAKNRLTSEHHLIILKKLLKLARWV